MELERRLILKQLRKKLVGAVLYRDVFWENGLLANRGIKPLLRLDTAQAEALSYFLECEDLKTEDRAQFQRCIHLFEDQSSSFIEVALIEDEKDSLPWTVLPNQSTVYA